MATKRRAAKAGLKAARRMPGKRFAARGGVKLGARAAKPNAYLLEVLQNRRFHERVRTGIGSTRAAYRRVSRPGKGASDLVTDPKARRDLGRALTAFQEAANLIGGAKARSRRRVVVRTVLPVVAIGGGGAVVLNQGLRQKVTGLVTGSSGDSG
jgi:hypothetical protein